MLRLFILAALLMFCAPAFGQNDQPWRMPGTQKVNPPQVSTSGATENPINWTFPAANLPSVEIGGESYFQLAPEAFGRRRNLGTDKSIETAVVLFTPKAIAMAKLLQIDHPEVITDLTRLVAAIAVGLAVEKPGDYKNEFLGKRPIFDMQYYFFQTKSGIVGASVSADLQRVLIIPSPTLQHTK